ncbi:MAG: DUF5104 domain-containing protein [Clostridia bacterium]|nr:DUF5104 domain-containing protein [Clostridia bacterium]
MLVSIIGYIMLLFLPFTSIFQAYEEHKYVTPVETAIVEKDADAFVDLLSESLIEENPDIENGIEKMMNSIDGEVTEIEHETPSFTSSNIIGTDCYHRYIYVIETTKDTYSMYLSYCTMSLFNEKDLGISRVIFVRSSDEKKSRIADPDLYFTTGKDRDLVITRYINEAKGNVDAKELFYIGEDDNYNLECYVQQENGMGIRGEDYVKVWLVPEGEEMTEERLKNPTLTYTGEARHYQKTNILPGKYWVYAETNNAEMEYFIGIKTQL